MKLPFRHHGSQERTRGQAMVEFALILPVLVLLLVLAVDFGRVFFGWVALNNVARIAANSAALNPDTWDGTGTVADKNAYRAEVLRDLQSINCAPTTGPTWTAASIPDPVFTSITGTANAYELGDRVTVRLTCRFTFITPIVGAILGNPLVFNVESGFAVRGGVINGVAVGSAPPPPPSCVDAVVPNMVGMSVSAARGSWTTAGFTGAFSPATGAGKDAETVSAQSTSPASNVGDCIPKTATVSVTSSAVTVCTAPDKLVPNLLGMTVATARSTWTSAGFTGTFTPSPGSSDTDQVTGQNVVSGTCKPPSTTITVSHSAPATPPPATCSMPQLVGIKVNSAEAPWRSAGFTTGSFTAQNGNGNYTVQYQSLIGGQTYPCSSSVTVGPVATP
jgi:beta-lactam-binding protein with PASTA domain